MKLDNPITLYPPPYTDQNGVVVTPEPIVMDVLDVSYHDNEASKVVSATIRNIPGSIILAVGIEYEKLGDFSRSQLKTLLEEKLGQDVAAVLQSKFPRTLEQDPNGPGTILTNMISSMGIKSTPNCSCRRHALEMNEKGVEWCENNLPTILAWLKEESAKRHLPYIESVAGLIVKRAIRTSKRLLSQESVNNA
jgi:hypothetical protein